MNRGLCEPCWMGLDEIHCLVALLRHVVQLSHTAILFPLAAARPRMGPSRPEFRIISSIAGIHFQPKAVPKEDDTLRPSIVSVDRGRQTRTQHNLTPTR